MPKELRIPPILPHLTRRMANLPQRVVLHRLHQPLKYIPRTTPCPGTSANSPAPTCSALHHTTSRSQPAPLFSRDRINSISFAISPHDPSAGTYSRRSTATSHRVSCARSTSTLPGSCRAGTWCPSRRALAARRSPRTPCGQRSFIARSSNTFWLLQQPPATPDTVLDYLHQLHPVRQMRFAGLCDVKHPATSQQLAHALSIVR
jgi:hypothetical protein